MDRRAQRHLFGITQSAIGLHLGEGLSFEIWAVEMRRVSRDRSANQWQIGDLLNFGEARFGEACQPAVDATGLSYQTLANLKSVAAKIELSRRREKLTFAHHAEVAGLPPAEQDRLLRLAEEGGWSRKVLRDKVAKCRSSEMRTPALHVTIDNTAIPLYRKSPITTETTIPLAGKPASRSEPIPLLTRPRPPAEVSFDPVPITAVGSETEASALRSALRALDAWKQKFQPVLDALAARRSEELREAIRRQLFGAENAAEGDEPTRLRPNLH